MSRNFQYSVKRIQCVDEILNMYDTLVMFYSSAVFHSTRGWRDSIMVSVSVCEAGRPGSSPGLSICISQKGGILPECYQLVPISADDWFNKGGPCVIMSM